MMISQEDFSLFRHAQLLVMMAMIKIKITTAVLSAHCVLTRFSLFTQNQ